LSLRPEILPPDFKKSFFSKVLILWAFIDLFLTIIKIDLFKF